MPPGMEGMMGGMGGMGMDDDGAPALRTPRPTQRVLQRVLPGSWESQSR